MTVVFFHRKRNRKNFSIESVFELVRNALPGDINSIVKEMRFFSRGVFKRLYISIEAAANQGDVNHITGDIHFISLFLRKHKTILTIHDLGLMNHPNRLARLIFKWFWIILPIRRSALITTVSKATSRELSQFVKLDPSRLRIIYDPVSPLFVASPKEFNKSKPVILQIGTKANKNIHRVLQALHGVSCKLEIVGELSPQQLIEAEDLGIEFRVSSGLSGEALLRKYQQADILIFASTLEGFGLPIVEANAVGRVVVTSNVSSMPEVAGDAAHLVDPFDVSSIRSGVVKVIEEDDYRDHLIQMGYENCKRFIAQKIAGEYADAYRFLKR